MFLFFLTWLPEKSIVGRIVLSAIGGVGFQGGGLLIFIVVSFLVARIAGEPDHAVSPVNSTVTAAVLLAATVWILGQHWMSDQERRITECLRESVGTASYVSARELSDRVHDCAHDPHSDSSDPSD